MTQITFFISPFLEKKTYGGSQLSKYMLNSMGSCVTKHALSLNNCTDTDPFIQSTSIDYIGAPKSRVATLLTNLCLLTGRLTSKSIIRIIKELVKNNADKIILDSSRLGILALVIRLIRKDVQVVTIYHNCERVILIDQIKQNYIYILSAPAVLLAEYLARKFSDKHVLLTDKDRLDLGITQNYEVLTPMLSNKFINKNREGIKVVGFLGSNYKPNNDAADYINEVLADEFPDIIFMIAGSCKLSSLARKNVHYRGFVNNIQTFFEEIDVFLSPVMTGSGINIKLIDSLSYGTPVICSDICASGFEEFQGHGVSIYSNTRKLIEIIKKREISAVSEEVIKHYVNHEKKVLERIFTNA